MQDDVLRQIAAYLNRAPDTAGRTARMAALVSEVNTRIASEALRRLSLDSTPYASQAWCVDISDCPPRRCRAASTVPACRSHFSLSAGRTAKLPSCALRMPIRARPSGIIAMPATTELN